MNAEELFNELNSNNFQFFLKGKNIKVKRTNGFSDDLLERVRLQKKDLVSLMSPMCSECAITLEYDQNEWFCPCCVSFEKAKEDLEVAFNNLLKRSDKDEIEQIIFEFHERVAIAMEGDSKMVIEEAEKIAKKDCISRWS